MKSENLIIRISPSLKEKARQAAEAEDKSMSEWLTDLIKMEVGNMTDYRMNEGRKAGYHFEFYDRETNELIYEGNVTGGNRTDCENLAWDYFRSVMDHKKYDVIHSNKTLRDMVRIHMKRESE